ncbi:acyltransferase family protein [Amycolatopsis benzoatilytica]|uniref:acyltransferase family protein n=1 Tax=Amycolatopsis benzoatilytica TaxID=346045 RepID=UPI000380D825|nr:acyltransferase family protein [Amycolatopsis benzoatilytica]
MGTGILRGPVLPGRVVDGGRRPEVFRPDIQALRAVAVGLVVLNHLWPARLTGGYVGVDVFFVISGFLINSHLLREHAGTGRIRLAKFYARRVRRLLPAAFLVLAVVVSAACFLMPFPRWESTAHEAIASALYWENWLLAANSVDYSALTQSASLTQHYWSLSVEEQFYLFWPLLLLLLFKIRVRRARLIGIAVVGLASLGFSVWFTEAAKSQAYFVTPGRVWEFAIGALLAFAGAKAVLPKIAANLASLAGLAAIVGAALLFDDQTAFPGATALLPAVGTGLVILAGAGQSRQWHTPLSSSPPVQWLGNVSYSLYLWHWPLIVLAPFAFPRASDAGMLTWPLKVGVVAAALAAAYLSKRFVEDPTRNLPLLSRTTGRTFAAMAAGMIVVCGAAGGLTWTYQRHADEAARDVAAESASPCHAASALAPGNACADRFGPARTVAMGPANRYYAPPEDCPPPLAQYATSDGTKTTTRCDFSGGAPAPTVVWLVGDSHAQQWQAPVLSIARKNHWLLYTSYLGGCPFAEVKATGYDKPLPGGDRRCTAWTKSMTGAIAQTRPAYVFTSFFGRHEPADDHSGRSQTEQYRDGLNSYWSQWTAAGAKVLVLADPPLNGLVRSPDCVVLNPNDPQPCAVPRSVAQPEDPLAAAARASADPNVLLIDLTDYFCDREQCYAVVGKVSVYYDSTHLNQEYSLSLEPMITAAAGIPG